ncbi:MAG: hypothetical protein OXF60_07310 [Gammaproteobacteria bacterium]|nr:hypothetical protein [Gammaproteobacteria bacterium]
MFWRHAACSIASRLCGNVSRCEPFAGMTLVFISITPLIKIAGNGLDGVAVSFLNITVGEQGD